MRKKSNNSAVLIVRMDAETKAALFRTATAHDVSVTDYVRQMIRSQLRPEAASLVSNRAVAA
jgi:plasmid stability protein